MDIMKKREDAKAEEKEFLKFYMEQTWEEMRHTEGMRERVAIALVTLASAITGFIVQQKYSAETLPLAVLVVSSGLFGLLFTKKLYQIHQLDQKRLDKWYIYYENEYATDSKVLALRDAADKETKASFPISKFKHSTFWNMLSIIIMIIGGYLCYKTWTVKPIIQPLSCCQVCLTAASVSTQSLPHNFRKSTS